MSLTKAILKYPCPLLIFSKFWETLGINYQDLIRRDVNSTSQAKENYANFDHQEATSPKNF